MKQIITSILDTDVYKASMMWFYIQHFSEVESTYTFNNRNLNMKFNIDAVTEIKRQVKLMSLLKLSDREYDWMKHNLKFLPVSFRQYLAAYRFNPDQVNISLDEDDNLNIIIKGKLRDTVLWEVPLMAIISEVYFVYMDTDWNMDGQEYNANLKARTLSEAGCLFADFSTRRRRNYESQDIVVREMSKYKGFVSTSNPHFAMKYNVKAIGTCAHEAISAVAALDSLNHPNACFMDRWSTTYEGDLGTMLPDTFGTDSCIRDFNLKRAKLWDGIRQDSGNPYQFTDKWVTHYKSLGIDPMSKTIIFSDSLDVERAIALNEYCKGKIKCSFGIGTYFSSDFMKVSDNTIKSYAMNMVIKLTSVNYIPTVKLSDTYEKAIGDPKMIDIMKYIHVSQYTL